VFSRAAAASADQTRVLKKSQEGMPTLDMHYLVCMYGESQVYAPAASSKACTYYRRDDVVQLLLLGFLRIIQGNYA
jgi:hypothetical protein